MFYKDSLKILLGLLVTLGTTWPLLAQDGGRFSGGFEGNANFFIRDSAIGADNTPQYDRQLIGAESWLDLNYSNYGFDLGVRFDLFNNSNLLNPTGSYTAEGIGKWYIRKSLGKFTITGGYIYDQIGSGMIFRAYEQRPLLIDNALKGARIRYQINDDWSIKAFTGRQRFLFGTFDATMRGGSIDGFKSFGGGETGKPAWSIAPGAGWVNRTLSDDQMNAIVNILSTYQEVDRVKPTYNNYMASVYNTLSAGSFSWYVELAYKSDDVFYDPMALRTTNNGGQSLGKLVSDPGHVIYTSVSYAKNKLGITAEYKRTENFDVRVDPLLLQNDGLIGFLPPMNRLNTYRMTARYNPATQFIGEQAFQLDVRYKINKKWSALANFSNITDLNDELLYREIYAETTFKPNRIWQLTLGLQLENYNQEIYEIKPEVPMVETVTPFAEFLYKFSRKKSLRLETQYMSTEQDFGSWIFVLAEVGIAPHWLFEASGMYNVSPAEKNGVTPDPILFPSFGVVYNYKSSRYSLRYVKQVEGVVCSGGICRLEPAFSGVKFQVSSIF